MRETRKYSRRGISNIVTSVMLVAAVALIGSFLVSWSSSSFAAKQLQIANQTNTKINLIKEDFVVEDVWFYTKSSVNYANVTIRNTGDVAIKISSIYVNNTQVWNTGQLIPIDNVTKITVQTAWGAGKPQSFWVKTARNAEVKQVWKS